MDNQEQLSEKQMMKNVLDACLVLLTEYKDNEITKLIKPHMQQLVDLYISESEKSECKE